ncbi:MAG: aminotransferase class I/II-fold pyridoxal phosphate-dependent enzyme [Bacilli bacterium]
MDTKFDILSINERLKQDKSGSVINGCIGTFRDDNHELISFKPVIEYLSLYSHSYLQYPNLYGNKDFLDGVFNWIFEKNADTIRTTHDICSIATLGGTGALWNVFKYYADQKGAVVISDICWPNNFTIAHNVGIDVYKYQTFDGIYNFNGLKLAIEEACKTHEKVLVLINDPCQNPTGYCMSKEEYDLLFDMLSDFSVGEKEVDVLFDIAYFNYSTNQFPLIEKLKDSYNFNIYIAFSASKSFGVYGIRCGALFGLMKNKDEVEKLRNKLHDQIRGSYSCPNYEAIGPIGNLLNNPEKILEMRKELTMQRDFLHSRSLKAREIFKSSGIKFLPCNDGFFISIITNQDAIVICSKLERMHIYVSPMGDKLIRIGVCSLTTSETEILARAIKAFDN